MTASANRDPHAYEQACLKEAKKVLAAFDRDLRSSGRAVEEVRLEGSKPDTHLIVIAQDRRRGEMRFKWALWDPWLWGPKEDGPTVPLADYVASLVLGDVFDS